MATRIIRKTWTVDDVLTDVTTAKMSDPDGNYGVKESVSGDIITADGVAMTRVSAGTYEHTFDDTVAIAYTAYVEFVYAAATYHFEIDVPARAVEAQLEADFDSLRAEIADFLGWGRDPSWDSTETARLASILKSGLHRVYYPISNKESGAVYEWSWMKPATTIATVAPYSTGEITIASGVVTLTGVGAAFPSWAALADLAVEGSIYPVDTRTDDTHIVLEDTSVDVDDSTDYSLNQSVYPLPADFNGAFDGNLVFAPGTNALYPSIKIVSNEMIRRWKQNNITSDQPEYAAIRTASFSALTGTRYEIEFYPSVDAEYILHGRYKVQPDTIDAVNKYPLGGVPMSEVILESCLAIAEQRVNDMQATRFHTEQFNLLLASAIQNDAQEHAPHNMGYNRDRSDEEGSREDRIDQHAGVAIHSFDGTFYRD